MKKFLCSLIAGFVIVTSVNASQLEEDLLFESPEVVSKRGYDNSDLWKIVESRGDYTSYSSVEECQESFKKWVMYTRALRVLELQHDPNAGEKYSWALENRKSFFEKADLYAPSSELYPMYLLGSWSQVALYSPEEKEAFIKDCTNGRCIPKNIAFPLLLSRYEIK